MWGDPGVQKFGGPFRKLSDNIMESVYAITYNFKSMLDHYIKIDDSFRGGDNETKTIPSDNSNTNIHTANEQLKVSIQIKKVKNHHVNMSFGMQQESSVIITKDTTVYMKDINKVLERQDSINNKTKQEELLRFKNKK
ncbi:hypothetical protein ACSTS3_16200 [Aquimarina muelleri]|uniref:hypothetical protein n=1 Tax=Aquimarina muelleri TaxID=279356 RepID=UPI003F682382